MKILIVNTSSTVGGAAIAANRLCDALKSTMPNQEVTFLSASDFSSFSYKLKKAFERLVIFIHNRFSRRNLFAVSIADTGFDITRTKAFREADVVHLHWFNQGMLSLCDLQKIASSGKPIIWTIHDMWSFTGVCHYTDGCQNFTNQCAHCPQMAHTMLLQPDICKSVFRKKARIYQNANITFVGCSQWIADCARQSSLLKGKTIVNIPNTIDTRLFAPMNQQECRKKFGLPQDKKLILFTSQKVTDPRKGVRFLYEAIQLLLRQNPELKDHIALIILGGKSEKAGRNLPAGPASAQFIKDNSYHLPYTSSEQEMAQIYNSADLFLIPSLQDNLPNTIMEALSCGVPCVGFHAGGIPEMIDHKQNGYVARFSDSQDLKDGIVWTLTHNPAQAARQKVLKTYSPEVVAEKYIQTYTTSAQR